MIIYHLGWTHIFNRLQNSDNGGRIEYRLVRLLGRKPAMLTAHIVVHVVVGAVVHVVVHVVAHVVVHFVFPVVVDVVVHVIISYTIIYHFGWSHNLTDSRIVTTGVGSSSGWYVYSVSEDGRRRTTDDGLRQTTTDDDDGRGRTRTDDDGRRTTTNDNGRRTTDDGRRSRHSCRLPCCGPFCLSCCR